MKKTSDEHEQEKRQENVEELEREYEEFLRSREEIDNSEETQEKSVVIVREEQ